MPIFKCQTSHIVHIHSTYQNSGLPVLNTKIKQNTYKTYENRFKALELYIFFERRTYFIVNFSFFLYWNLVPRFIR